MIYCRNGACIFARRESHSRHLASDSMIGRRGCGGITHRRAIVEVIRVTRGGYSTPAASIESSTASIAAEMDGMETTHLGTPSLPLSRSPQPFICAAAL